VNSFASSPGTRDILAPDSSRWRQFQSSFAEVVERAGYQYIIPPMFEELGVFLRLGDSTEVVTKEMYDFVDKGGRRIALRPEQTASVCRAFVEHRPTTPCTELVSLGGARTVVPLHVTSRDPAVTVTQVPAGKLALGAEASRLRPTTRQRRLAKGKGAPASGPLPPARLYTSCK
jgi:hypothetical protein